MKEAERSFKIEKENNSTLDESYKLLEKEEEEYTDNLEITNDNNQPTVPEKQSQHKTSNQITFHDDDHTLMPTPSLSLVLPGKLLEEGVVSNLKMIQENPVISSSQNLTRISTVVVTETKITCYASLTLVTYSTPPPQVVTLTRYVTETMTTTITRTVTLLVDQTFDGRSTRTDDPPATHGHRMTVMPSFSTPTPLPGLTPILSYSLTRSSGSCCPVFLFSHPSS